MTMKEADIQVSWGHISLKLWGNEDDPAILAIHGLMDNAGSFDNLIPLLPQHYFYIGVDLPGHGKSSHFPPHLPIHTINYIMAYTLVMEYFKKDKYIIMGHSYGGQLGYLYAQIYPEKVEKLIMLDTIHTFPISVKYFKRHLQSKFSTYFTMEKKIQVRNSPQYTYEEALDRVMLGRYFPITEKSARNLLNRMLVSRGDGKYELSLDQRLKNITNPLHDIRYVINTMKEYPVKCPILIVFGIDSTDLRQYLKPILNVLKQQKNVNIKYAPGHHDVHQDNPESVAPHIVKFLSNRKSKL